MTDETPTFDEWLARLTDNPYAPIDDPGDVSAANLRWLRRLFDTEGPVAREVADQAFLTHQVELANDAVAAVVADLHRTTAHRPTVSVEVIDGILTIVINSGYSAPSMWAVEPADALAEVADYFQAELDQEIRCWPVCERHDLGLHAEVRDGVAVWWCRRFQHSVAPIGRLGLTSPRRTRRKARRR